MSDATATTAMDERVRKSLDEVLSALSILTDEVATARSDDWNNQGHDVDGMGRNVLIVSDALACALVDRMPELELEYGDLDEVFVSIAARLAKPELVEAAEYLEKLFQELREISYNSIADVENFPDVEDTNAAVERAVELLLDMDMGRRNEPA